MEKLLPLVVLMLCAVTAFAERSVTIDPSFAYYKDRSPESVVDEIRVNGYDDVRMVCTSESGINGELVKAFRDAGVKVWFLTFINGTYSTTDLPQGWEKWKMKLRKADGPDGFTYLSLNNSEYRQWKKKQIVKALNAHPFYGVDLIEPFFPAYEGPESDRYGCLCESCVAEFKKMYPGVSGPPDFDNPDSPHYWKTDTELYEKWVGFRVSSVVSFLDDLVNGKDGIREKCPQVKVATWSLGLDVPDQIKKLREWEAIDGAAIVKRVKPDMHVIQTDWPDWSKSELSSKYPLHYKKIADSIHDAAPLLSLMLQADMGSRKNMRRSRAWIAEVEKSAKNIGCMSTTWYEYSLGEYVYTEPPAVMKAVMEGAGTIKLIFNKCLDSVTASNVANYTLSSGKVDYAKVDGNVVRLSVSGVEGGVTVGVSGLSDDETRRLYHDYPVCTMERAMQVNVEQGEEKRD